MWLLNCLAFVILSLHAPLSSSSRKKKKRTPQCFELYTSTTMEMFPSNESLAFPMHQSWNCFKWQRKWQAHSLLKYATIFIITQIIHNNYRKLQKIDKNSKVKIIQKSYYPVITISKKESILCALSHTPDITIQTCLQA